jgi:hypothetical protein
VTNEWERAFDRLQLPDVDGRRRRLAVKDVMPQGEDWKYGVALTGGFVVSKAGHVPLLGFEHLFSFIDALPAANRLDDARRAVVLIEGAHKLPERLEATLLALTGSSGLVHARRMDSGSNEVTSLPIQDFVRADSMFDLLPEPFTEYVIADSSGSWMLRIVDDEPLAFFAIRSLPARSSAFSSFGDDVLELTGKEMY